MTATAKENEFYVDWKHEVEETILNFFDDPSIVFEIMPMLIPAYEKIALESNLHHCTFSGIDYFGDGRPGEKLYFTGNRDLKMYGEGWHVNSTPTAHAIVPGQYAEVYFFATGIEVGVYPNSDRGGCEVFIDDISIGIFDGPTMNSSPFINVKDLNLGVHHLRIVHLGARKKDGEGWVTAFVHMICEPVSKVSCF